MHVRDELYSTIGLLHNDIVRDISLIHKVSPATKWVNFNSSMTIDFSSSFLVEFYMYTCILHGAPSHRILR